MEKFVEPVVACLFHQSPYGLKKVGVTIVLPSPLFSDGLDHLGRSAPSLFRSLGQVVLLQRFISFFQKLSAG